MLEKRLEPIKDEVGASRFYEFPHLGRIEAIPKELTVEKKCDIPDEISIKSERMREIVKTTFLDTLFEGQHTREISTLEELRNFTDTVVDGILTKIQDFENYEDLIFDAIPEDEYLDVVLGNPLENLLDENGYSDIEKLKKSLGNMSKSDLNSMTPSHAPEAERWINDGGKIYVNLEDDNKLVWRYVYVDGKYADYFGDQIVFPEAAIHPVIKPINLEGFTGDRYLDKKAYLEKQNEIYGIKEIPDGYALHHGYKSGEFILVSIEYHGLFTHSGGHSLEKQNMYE